MKSWKEVETGIRALTEIYNEKLKKYNAVAVYKLTTTVTHQGQAPVHIIARITSRDSSSIGSFDIVYDIDNELSIRDIFFAMLSTQGYFKANNANCNTTNTNKVISSFKSALDEMDTKRTIKTLKDTWSS